jgi:hypothetical protein
MAACPRVAVSRDLRPYCAANAARYLAAVIVTLRVGANAPDALTPANKTPAVRTCIALNQFVAGPLMGPFARLMGHELFERAAEVPFPQRPRHSSLIERTTARRAHCTARGSGCGKVRGRGTNVVRSGDNVLKNHPLTPVDAAFRSCPDWPAFCDTEGRARALDDPKAPQAQHLSPNERNEGVRMNGRCENQPSRRFGF